MEEQRTLHQHQPFALLYVEKQPLLRKVTFGTKWCAKQTKNDGIEEADVDMSDPASEDDPNSLGGW
jgi:hypothetical protein